VTPYPLRQPPVPRDAPYRYTRPDGHVQHVRPLGTTILRDRRLKEFTVIVAGLGHADPADAPASAVAEAARQLGVRESTARAYQVILRKQRQGEGT